MIHRVIHNKENPYFQMNRTALVDNRLSWKAVGLLTYLISKPDQWVIREADLINQHTDGRDSVQSGMRELREAGYVTKVSIRDDAGKIIRWECHIFECPQQNDEPNAPADENIDDCDQNTENPDSGKSKIWGCRPLSDIDCIGKKRGRKTPARTEPIPVRQISGFPIDGTPQSPGPTFSQRAAEDLYNGLASAGKIVEPPDLRDWAETIRQFILRTDVTPDRLRRELDWFIQNIRYKYAPKIRCAESFCKKFVAVQDAREGWESDQAAGRPIETAVSDDPQPDPGLPKIINGGKMSAEDFRKMYGDN